MSFLDRFRRTDRKSAASEQAPSFPAWTLPPPVSTLPPPSLAPADRGADRLKYLAGGADRICVVDCETTGVYNTDRIVELAIVTLDFDGNIIEAWDTLMHPQRDVSASHIHGLTADILADAPRFADVAGDVALRLDGACLAAHNLPFDGRMLRAEFSRLHTELTLLAGIDTLPASGAKLATACEMHGIALHQAHSALADATATAELLLRVASLCRQGAPVAAPRTFVGTGRVLRRRDARPVRVPDPPHVAALAASLDHAGLAANLLAYLELVGRAVADLHLDADERRQLADFAHELGLTAAHIAQAHRRFLNDLIDAALLDHVVTDEELDMLLRIAVALAVDTATVEQRARAVLATSVDVTITAGMRVVFTGDDPNRSRDDLLAHAAALGLAVQESVTKHTDLLVAYDPASASGKAAKARSYGVPIVSTEQFSAAGPGARLEAHTSAVEARKVVVCPDCHATWTVPARAGGRTSRRCDACSGVADMKMARITASGATRADGGTVEELVCAACSRRWTRQRVRGRKPTRCPDCL